MAPPETDDLLAPGTTFGRYTIVRRLGQGGMGAVYEATHVALKKRVAIKVLHRAIAARADAPARFVREGEVAARLHHAHVVDVSDVGQHEGRPYLVMEYLEGEDLDSRLRAEGKIPLETLVDLMAPVCSAVAAAHGLGVIHRDLKPANVFLTRTLQGAVHPKLLDFGTSKLLDNVNDPKLTESAALLGTALYLAPEQAESSRDVDARCDQYALGVILYECATGAHPFARFNRDGGLLPLLLAIVGGDFPAPRTLHPELPKAFEGVVLKAMALKPADRYESVRALGLALLPFGSAATRSTWGPVLTRSSLERTGGLDALPEASDSATTLSRSAAGSVPPKAPARFGRRIVVYLGVTGAIAAVAIGVASMRTGTTPSSSTPATEPMPPPTQTPAPTQVAAPPPAITTPTPSTAAASASAQTVSSSPPVVRMPPASSVDRRPPGAGTNLAGDASFPSSIASSSAPAPSATTPSATATAIPTATSLPRPE